MSVDTKRIEAAVVEILAAVGEDPTRDGLLMTPGRVARMYEELFAGVNENPADHLEVTFAADHDEMVMVRDIPFASLCEHHMIPFMGRAHVAYIPGSDGRITGLSKLARLVDGYAKRLQVQERMTSQIADAIEFALEPKGVLVVVDAEHLCMSMRGVKKSGTSTITSIRGHAVRTRPLTAPMPGPSISPARAARPRLSRHPMAGRGPVCAGLRWGGCPMPPQWNAPW
jgi:GTP cyclohydrolase I